LLAWEESKRLTKLRTLTLEETNRENMKRIRAQEVDIEKILYELEAKTQESLSHAREVKTLT